MISLIWKISKGASINIIVSANPTIVTHLDASGYGINGYSKNGTDCRKYQHNSMGYSQKNGINFPGNHIPPEFPDTGEKTTHSGIHKNI